MLKSKTYTARRAPQKSSRFRKILPLAGVLLIAAVAGGFAYVKYHGRRSAPDTTGTTINYRPPTQEEKKQADTAKDKIVQEQQQSASKDDQPPATQPTTLTPFISYFEKDGSNITASGYIGGIFEDDGICTLTLKNGSVIVNKQSKGFKDFSHTSCTPFSFPSSELTKTGTWTATLTYSSPSGSGTSEPRTLEVQ